MYKRRQKTIKENMHRDLELWTRIGKVLKKIGRQGMSGDETDSQPYRIKEMRRMRHPWMSPKITDLWVAVDSYQYAVDEELLIKKRDRRGNPGLPRLDGSRIESSVGAPKFLPKNWYAENWWRTLPEGAQLAFAPEKAADIPVLSSRGALPI